VKIFTEALLQISLQWLKIGLRNDRVIA